MSGLEIVALIPACIGAYTAIAAEYRQWRKSRAERKSKKNMQLQKTLAKSGLKLEAEFEDRRRRLGHIFEKGDDTAQTEIARHLIYLTTALMSLLLSQKDDPTPLIHPHHASIQHGATAARDAILRALAQQSRRIERPNTKPNPLPPAPLPQSPRPEQLKTQRSAPSVEHAARRPPSTWRQGRGRESGESVAEGKRQIRYAIVEGLRGHGCDVGAGEQRRIRYRLIVAPRMGAGLASAVRDKGLASR